MEKDRRSEIAGDEGEWWGGGGDSVQQAMRAHCPNYNEASYFFRAERSRSICPRQRRLDDSGPLPGLASETKCKRIVGTSPSSRIGQNEKRTAARKWKMKKESERESMILRRNVAVFPAIHGTDRFFWPLLTTHSYLAAWDPIVDPYLHHQRRHRRIILFGPLPLGPPVCMRRTFRIPLFAAALLTTFKYLSAFRSSLCNGPYEYLYLLWQYFKTRSAPLNHRAISLFYFTLLFTFSRLFSVYVFLLLDVLGIKERKDY